MPWVSGSSQRFSGKVYSVSATRGLVLEKSFKSFIGSFVPSNLEAIGHRKAVTGLSQLAKYRHITQNVPVVNRRVLVPTVMSPGGFAG